MQGLKTDLNELYEKDPLQWAEENIRLLREGKLDLIDLENLIRELEISIKDKLQDLISNLSVILEHLYKWDNMRHLSGGGASWIRSIGSTGGGLRDFWKPIQALRKG